MVAKAGATVVVNGQQTLHGLQHAEQQTVLAYFYNTYKAGVFTLMGFSKTSAAMLSAAGLAAGTSAITIYFSGPGKHGVGGTEIFVVPGPEVGSGISFVIAAALIGVFAYVRAKRSPS